VEIGSRVQEALEVKAQIGGVASAVIHVGEVVKGTETGRLRGNEASEKDLVGKQELAIMVAVVESTAKEVEMVSVKKRRGRHLLFHNRVVDPQMVRTGLMLILRIATTRANAMRHKRRLHEKKYRSARRRVQTRVHEKRLGRKAEKAEKAEKVLQVAKRQGRLPGHQIGRNLNGLLLRPCHQFQQRRLPQRLHVLLLPRSQIFL
jgi:hypothetical protein